MKITQVPFDTVTREVTGEFPLGKSLLMVSVVTEIHTILSARDDTLRPLRALFLVESPAKEEAVNFEIEGKKLFIEEGLSTVYNEDEVPVGFGSWLSSNKPLLLVGLYM